MTNPALQAKIMPTDIIVDGDAIKATNLTNTFHSFIEVKRVFKAGLEPDFLEVALAVIIILFFQVFLVPLEFLEEYEAPPSAEVNQVLDFLKECVEFVEYFEERQYLKILLLSR